MALRALMLGRKLSDTRKKLDEAREILAGFEKREAELTEAIAEVETDEEQETVAAEVEKYEEEKAVAEETAKNLEEEVQSLEAELAGIERSAAPVKTDIPEQESRKGEEIMINRLKEMNSQERDAFFAREDVKSFLEETRTAIKERRAISNVGLTIPEVMLGILRENITDYSKLYKYVDVRNISGEGRLVIMGTIPEAVWTDCCANLNELSLGFFDTEVNCWKVGGYFAVCNATLEDSDLNLASEILTAIGQAIGYALDKAILYGTGTRMPLGAVTRLAQTAKPSGYPDTARTWVDLHTSNIISIAASKTGVDFFKAIVEGAAATRNNYASGERVWIMNESTYTKVITEAMTLNDSGAIVSSVNGTMPVIGGKIEILNFVPNNVIVGGYFGLYLLAERAGQKFATSEHIRFLQDQTVLKGTARYDGQPVIAEAFVAIGIGGTTPTATMTFAPDDANSDDDSSAEG